MDGNDNFVVVWEGDLQSSAWGVYGDYFTAQGKSATTPPATWSETGPMLLNNTPNNRSSYMGSTTVDLYDSGPRVAMSAAGDFVVTWADFSSVATGYDVYAQQFAPGASPLSGAVPGQPDHGLLASDARRGRWQRGRLYDCLDELRPG